MNQFALRLFFSFLFLDYIYFYSLKIYFEFSFPSRPHLPMATSLCHRVTGITQGVGGFSLPLLL